MKVNVSLDISIKIVTSKYEVNALTNNKVIAQISRNQAKFNNLNFMAKAILKANVRFQRHEGVVTRVILSKYEDNPLNNNKVIANNSTLYKLN